MVSALFNCLLKKKTKNRGARERFEPMSQNLKIWTTELVDKDEVSRDEIDQSCTWALVAHAALRGGLSRSGHPHSLIGRWLALLQGLLRGLAQRLQAAPKKCTSTCKRMLRRMAKMTFLLTSMENDFLVTWMENGFVSHLNGK